MSGEGLTYSVPLKAKLKLYCTDPDREDFDTTIQDVYLGPIPYMTDQGTFVINGAERIVMSQLHRSPGVFFGQSVHANGTKLYSARIIPFRGSWIEFATDINNVMYAYIDRKKKLPVTTLLRAIGLESDKDIIRIFDLAEEVKVNKTNLKKSVGRKLAGRILHSWVEDMVDPDTGEVNSIERNEVIVERGEVLTDDHIDAILESGIRTLLLEKENVGTVDYTIIFNTLAKDPPTLRRRRYSISTDSCATRSRRTTLLPVRSSPTFSSAKSVTTSGKWAVSVSTRSSASTLRWT